MNRPTGTSTAVREKLRQLSALSYLLVLGGLTLAGPYGVLAWGENLSVLEKREAQIAKLEQERADLENKVALLGPEHVDPDIAGELIRRDLNAVHPDEYIFELDQH